MACRQQQLAAQDTFPTASPISDEAPLPGKLTLRYPELVDHIFLTVSQSVMETKFGPIRTMSPYFLCSFLCKTSGRLPRLIQSLQRFVVEASHGPGILFRPW